MSSEESHRGQGPSPAGAIIAMHDVNPANSRALPAILDFLLVNGCQFVTFSDILFR
jgi:peptidoglycan/xylan/chitin deacetylase (PgdA/CDA1 family)